MARTQTYPVLNFLKKVGAKKLIPHYSVDRFERLLRIKSVHFWNTQGGIKALKLFHEASIRVPAYKDFIKKNKIRPNTIKTILDFQNIPITTKKNYIQKYSAKDRSWDGDLGTSSIIAISSGTTGKPTLWPRSVSSEEEAKIIHELVYKNFFRCHEKKTLMVICFPMGIYVSGVATLLPSVAIAEKKYNISVISAGTRKDDVLKIIKEEISEFEQLVLIGHPYFIKDVLESSKKAHLSLSRKKIRMLFCSEGFNEGWRDYVINLIGAKNSPYDAISTYGSSEMLLMANETPLSIFVRRWADTNEVFYKKIFTAQHLPNLFQYNPLMRYAETVDRNLVFTSDSGLPLIRFDMHDTGEIISFDNVLKALESTSNSWKQDYRKNTGFSNYWQLPFITLENRSDNTIIFYAANIYPENIRDSLDGSSYLSKITGKFTMVKKATRRMEQTLEINIELKEGIKKSASLKKQIQKQLYSDLQKNNLEYKYIVQNYKNTYRNLQPVVKLWDYQSEKYFKQGLKSKFIQK